MEGANLMSRIKQSKEKYEQLFKTVQKLDPSDSELVSQLPRFIFGEVFYIGELINKQRKFVTSTILPLLHILLQLKEHVNAVLNVEVSPLENQCVFADGEGYKRGLMIQKELYGDEIKKFYQYLPEEIVSVSAKFLTKRYFICWFTSMFTIFWLFMNFQCIKGLVE